MVPPEGRSWVLITGGAGFLGINLIRHLLQEGYCSLRSLDIADFSYPERDRIDEVRGDIRDRGAVARAVAGVRWLIHAAAALPLCSAAEIRSTEVDGTRVLLDESLQAGVERFIYISSTAVYGIPRHGPLVESDPLVGVGPYGEAKIAAERLCGQYRARGLCLPVLRPKSFIGPERLGAFELLYGWAREGRNFPIVGKGANRYQLLDVADLCDAVCRCLTLPAQRVNTVFNIGAQAFVTLREDFQAVLDEAGFGKRIIPIPAPLAVAGLRLLEALRLSPLYRWIYETAGKDSIVSIEKARKHMSFAPRYSNRDALLRNFRWYLEQGKAQLGAAGVGHRTPWKPGVLRFLKGFF